MSRARRATAGPGGPVVVVGGAGYIGAHVVRALEDAGRDVVVVDNLSTGVSERVEGRDVRLVDVADPARVGELAAALRGAGAVIHLAAHKDVAESVRDPLRYYGDNVRGVVNVLEAMREAGVDRLVFSSTAAVYAALDRPVAESDPTAPGNPYGSSKLAGEWLVAGAARAYGFSAAVLRYFNVAGAASLTLADRGAASLLPRAARALLAGERPQLFGTDYDTPDGTTVRDYVHVLDVAQAHATVADHLGGPGWGPGTTVLNVGTGRGASVREVLDRLLQVSGAGPELGVVEQARRPGDIPFSTARVDRIAELTGWRARHDLDAIVADVWRVRDALREP